jgi:LPXTG-site transpeptidase (sortase) family protein
VTPSRRRGSRGRGPCRPAAPAAPLALVAAAGLLAASLVLGACQWTAGDAGAKAAEPPTSEAPQVVSRASRPVSIAIPAAGVDARVVPVGLGTDGAMEVPAVDLAGWYRLGPRPGERGPAVIVGHVDSRKGPAVFHRLGQVRKGDRIVVGQGGGAAVAFAVERVERVAKESLPVGRIWNRTSPPVLRLITCGGSFDRSTGHYRDNVIVYAKLAS